MVGEPWCACRQGKGSVLVARFAHRCAVVPGKALVLLIINGFVEIPDRSALSSGFISMKTIARDDVDTAEKQVNDQEADFKPLTAEEAQALRAKSPSVSPWRVIAGQLVVGVLVAFAAWGLTGRQNLGWSAGYGALAVVIPAAVFARGLTGKFSSLNPGTAVFGFFLWEMVKMALSLAMLIAAPRLITALSWPAMLVGLVVTMKAAWLAVVLTPRRRQQRDE
jgi:ATP synthase protein I